jgi:hypothetical protein
MMRPVSLTQSTYIQFKVAEEDSKLLPNIPLNSLMPIALPQGIKRAMRLPPSMSAITDPVRYLSPKAEDRSPPTSTGSLVEESFRSLSRRQWNQQRTYMRPALIHYSNSYRDGVGYSLEFHIDWQTLLQSAMISGLLQVQFGGLLNTS